MGTIFDEIAGLKDAGQVAGDQHARIPVRDQEEKGHNHEVAVESVAELAENSRETQSFSSSSQRHGLIH
ncbi:hypothetical protein KIN20_010443 [Parelaphostrongylus tenuis]|uniref:Uncharacterized protein n=1 Tax=Parelaphostrongylus tenuis TaxID=148309 RepID=A0AAD5QIT2_PARTN|nr:hypothetical protein KIN20_010443 [Parelaphostrongylus tenuis]